ncbi:MAG: DUF2555 domain-containing protein [Thermostichales cyanobacterium BF4_bins_65]
MSAPTQLDPRTMTAEQVAEVAARLEANAYPSVFGSLEDWHLLKAVAFHNPSLVEPYLHLLELEVDDD